MKRSLLYAVFLTIAALPHAAIAADVPANQEQYARPNQLVDIGGRKLNLFCLGSGSPTVIFDAGATLAGWDWLLVHPAIAKRTKACIYDRAGLGFSEHSSRPGTSAHAVEDLHALLQAAQLAPPFVLVAHSYGAMNARLFAHRYPTLLAGLVLVDGHHEDEMARLDRITQGGMSKMMAGQDAEYKQCADAAKTGFPPGSKAFSTCVSSPPEVFGRALSAAYRNEVLSQRFWNTSLSELANLNTVSAAQLRAARGSLGDLPLMCLTRGVSPYLIPGKPQSPTNKAIEAENKKMQDEIARLSSKGRNRVVAGAGHSIHLDKPQAVIDAVLEILSAVKP
ncbi:MAG: alpha/beta fold hydrolase [Burkholderiaceae bacterium]